jgi:hypothetical protein
VAGVCGTRIAVTTGFSVMVLTSITMPAFRHRKLQLASPVPVLHLGPSFTSGIARFAWIGTAVLAGCYPDFNNRSRTAEYGSRLLKPG